MTVLTVGGPETHGRLTCDGLPPAPIKGTTQLSFTDRAGRGIAAAGAPGAFTDIMSTVHMATIGLGCRSWSTSRGELPRIVVQRLTSHRFQANR
ncbi:hypothetical protein ACIBQ1_44370 [Nonomuraea sp. NPDC050153]|uniref:hypothetical protein n=1 Tax=Nonomuraea sp. NPDC050153 TaxID=3364359 RepID=UPI00379E5C4C